MCHAITTVETGWGCWVSSPRPAGCALGPWWADPTPPASFNREGVALSPVKNTGRIAASPSIATLWSFWQQQQPQHPNEDQSVQSLRRKHISIQFGTMDTDQNRRKEDRLIPLEDTTKRNLNIKWPKNISSEDLYKKTKQKNWSTKIKTRRLRWYGHAMQLPEETPAKIALWEAYRKVKKIRGSQTTIWISVLKKDLSTLGLTVEDTTKLALDRKEWSKVVWHSRAPCTCTLRA